MPKKFNQLEYQEQWKKENMTVVNARYKKDFVQEFKDACKVLGITQSDVIRAAMSETIKKAYPNKE